MKAKPINRIQYTRDWKTLHHQCERQQYPNFKNALNAQVKPVIDYIKLHGVTSLYNHLHLLVSPQPMAEAYKKCYQSVGVKGATFAYRKIEAAAKGKSHDDIELKESPSFFSEYWRKLMSLFFNTQGAERVTQVTETTREKIQELLAKSQDLPISERATYLEKGLKDPEFTRMRALRIARTEATTAANYGALIGAQSSDYETSKIWLPILDANTRPDHAEMDGLPAIGLDEMFIVGTTPMSYPGDQTAPANEVVNCRCSLAIVPMLSENGLPILKKS